MRALVLIPLLCAALALPGISRAQGVPDEARILYDQGLKLYDQGNYTAAIQLWEKTYALTPLPAILHNIAKAQEENGDPKSALATWRRYLDVAPSSERATANARIAALEIVVAALDQAAPSEGAKVDDGAAVVESGETREAISPPLPDPKPPKPERGPRSYRGLAVALMGVGATSAVVGGSVLAGQARAGASDAATSGCVVYGGSTLCEGDAASSLSAGRLQFVLGSAIIGSGVALGAGSVVVAVRPGSGGADLALTARW